MVPGDGGDGADGLAADLNPGRVALLDDLGSGSGSGSGSSEA